MVVSICGVVSVGLTAPLGVALSVTGLDDVDSGAGTRGGRGMAVAGLIVGIVITALLVLVLAVGMGVAEPTPET
jgi:tetrahydromethanopterin S-methyltransferase subunit B